MTGKIAGLSEEQERELVEWREKWLRVGRATGPVDRPAAEAAVADAYRERGLEPPKLILWARSPLEGAAFAAALSAIGSQQQREPLNVQLDDQIREQLQDQLWNQLRDQLSGQLADRLRDQLCGQLCGQLRDQLGEQLRGQLWVQLGDQLGDQIWDKIGDQLRDQLDEQLRDQLSDQLSDRLWSQLRVQLDDQIREQLQDQLWNQLRDQLSGQLADRLRDQLCGQLCGQLGAQLRDKLDEQLGARLIAQLWDQLNRLLRGQIRNRIWSQLWSQIRGQDVRNQINACMYGQFDVYWLATYAFMRHLGATSTANPDPQLRVAENCGWWWPFSGAVVMSERPSALHLDDNGRLHNTKGAAISFSDGWGVCAVNGTRVDASWVDGSLTATQVLNEPNMERRIAGVTILGGWDSIVRQCPTRVIDADSDPKIGELLSVDLPDSPDTRFVRARCGTGRTIVFRVDSESRTALEAQAKSYGVPTDMIRKLEVRT